MRITALVVNYNAGPALSDCVRALLRDNALDDVRVLDNASSDHSLAVLERQLTAEGVLAERVRILRNDVNLGYGTAMNRGARERAAEARAAGELPDEVGLLLINPDCVLAARAAGTLSDALVADPGAALAAPLVLGRNALPERSSLRRFPTARSAFNTFSGLSRLADARPEWAGISLATRGLVDSPPAEPIPAEAVSGACFLLRLSDFLAVEGFDEAYVMHGEDLDLMYRLARAGRRRLLVATARATHRQGLSSASRPLWVHWHKHLGMRRFYRRHQAGEHALATRGLVETGIWARWCAGLPLQLWRSFKSREPDGPGLGGRDLGGRNWGKDSVDPP